MNVGFDVLSDQEKQTLQQRLGRQGGLPEGALAAVKNVICVGSGKGGVGKSTVTANLAAALQAEGKQAAALDADVWGYSIPRMLGVHGRPMVSAERKILPLEAPRRRQGDLDRVLPQRARPGDHLARPDAPQGDPPVPRGRRLGRARLPADRPAARHRRRLDDARPAAAAGEVRDRHDARSRPRRTSPSAPPRPRCASTSRSPAWSRTCPASRRPTASASRSSARAAASCSPTSSTCRCSARSRSRRSCGSAPTRARPLVLEDPDAPAAQALFHAARGRHRRDAAGARRCSRRPSGPPVPEVTGTALPMAPVRAAARLLVVVAR